MTRMGKWSGWGYSWNLCDWRVILLNVLPTYPAINSPPGAPWLFKSILTFLEPWTADVHLPRLHSAGMKIRWISWVARPVAKRGAGDFACRLSRHFRRGARSQPFGPAPRAPHLAPLSPSIPLYPPIESMNEAPQGKSDPFPGPDPRTQPLVPPHVATKSESVRPKNLSASQNGRFAQLPKGVGEASVASWEVPVLFRGQARGGKEFGAWPRRPSFLRINH